MPDIGFAPDLIPLIQSGEKQVTYRLGTKYSTLRPGDIFGVMNSATRQVITSAQVTGTAQATFGELPLDDPRHEPYRDRSHMSEVFASHYGRPVDPSEPVIILEFSAHSGEVQEP